MSAWLEIKTKSGEGGMIVPPVENSFVVNIGDSMRMWTNNRFRLDAPIAWSTTLRTPRARAIRWA